MSKIKSLAEQIEQIEASKEKLTDYEKLFDKACKINFGCDAKNIRKIMEKNEKTHGDLGEKICAFYNLQTDKDIVDFIAIMCTENNLNFFRNKRGEESV